MKNEFYRHKKNDKVKWVFTGIAFVLVFVLLAGVCMQLFGTGKVKPSEWFKKPDIEQTTPVEPEDEIGGEAVITDKTANGGISLMTTSISPANYEDYGVSALAETAYTITATVSPIDSTVTNFSWSTAWKNAASTWANGKSVSDYVTISTSANNLSATVSCLQAFGEPITITIKYDYNEDISASCQVDYIKRLESIKATVSDFDYGYYSGDFYAPTISTSYGVGTLDGTITYSNCYLELSNEALNFLQNNYFYRIGFQKFDDEGYAYRLQQKSKITVDLKDGQDGFTTKYWSYNEVCENEEYYYHTDFLDMSDYRCLASSGSGFYAKFIEYYNAAFHNLVDATANQIRLAVDYTYSYTTVNGEQIYNGTAYSDYTSIQKDGIPSSSYLSVNGVTINNGSLVF